MVRPDVVVIVTDDQRWDMLEAMPVVQRELVGKGITFRNAFVVNPECCPSRASILTGRYSHGTGVYTNDGPTGFRAFNDSATMATWLHSAGYRTALVGKYLNHYRGPEAPPGWDQWTAYSGPYSYYDYTLAENGELERLGNGPEDYSTDVLARRAVELIRRTPSDEPLFLYFSPFAPHPPAIPAPRHQDALPHLASYRPPSYSEDDVSDKPGWLRAIPPISAEQRAFVERSRLSQHRALLAVDDAVGTILGALRAAGRLSRSMVIYLSDNGHAWGEHRWIYKGVPYEEVIRIPLVIRYDPLIQEPRTDDHLVGNIDVAPTVSELVGATARGADGRSLLPLLLRDGAPFRSRLLIEHVSAPRRGGQLPASPTFCALRTTSRSYVRYETGDEELYLLDRDPYQLRNRAGDPGQGSTVARLRSITADLCSPLPPGMPPFA